MLGVALSLIFTHVQREPIRPQEFEADLVLLNIGDTLGKARSYDLSESVALTKLAYETETVNGSVPLLELSRFEGQFSFKKTEYRFKVGEGIRKMRAHSTTLVNNQKVASVNDHVQFFDFGMTAPLFGTDYARFPLVTTSSNQIRANATGTFDHYREVLLVISTESPTETQSLLKEKLPGFTGLILYTSQPSPTPESTSDRVLVFPPERDATTYRIRFDKTGWHARTIISYSGLIRPKTQFGD